MRHPVLRYGAAALCVLGAVYFLLPLSMGVLHIGMLYPAAGLLLAARSDYIEVNGRRYPRTPVALSEQPVSDGGGYQALWGGTEWRKHEKAVQAAAGVAAQSAQAG